MHFMNQKGLIIGGIVALLVLALIGVYYYQMSLPVSPGQDTSPSPSPSVSSSTSVILESSGITVEGEGSGGLVACRDLCDDGICQKTDPQCKYDLNCICAETPQDCPADCK